MPDSGISDGSTLTSSFYDTYVRQQVVVTCTSATRPTNIEGRMIYETDTDRVLLGTGSGSNWVIMAEPAQSFTPTWTNVTQGTGASNVGTYHRSDGYCDATYALTLGTGGALTGIATLTLPITAANTSDWIGTAVYTDASPATYSTLALQAISTTQFYVLAVNVAGTYVATTGTGANVPITWTVNDNLVVNIRYRTQYRYS